MSQSPASQVIWLMNRREDVDKEEMLQQIDYQVKVHELISEQIFHRKYGVTKKMERQPSTMEKEDVDSR